jgi:hypothetical protein
MPQKRRVHPIPLHPQFVKDGELFVQATDSPAQLFSLVYGTNGERAVETVIDILRTEKEHGIRLVNQSNSPPASLGSSGDLYWHILAITAITHERNTILSMLGEGDIDKIQAYLRPRLQTKTKDDLCLFVEDHGTQERHPTFHLDKWDYSLKGKDFHASTDYLGLVPLSQYLREIQSTERNPAKVALYFMNLGREMTLRELERRMALTDIHFGSSRLSADNHESMRSRYSD